MLEFLRRAVRSWVAKALLGLLVASFAFWGIGDIARGLSTRVAQVGERDISVEEYGRVLQNQARRYGIEPGRIDETGLDRFALAALLREAAFEEAAREFGLSAPDAAVAEQVRADPSFRAAGDFDPAQYRATVQRAFGSVPQFEETLRRSLAASVLRRAASVGAAPPPGAAGIIARRQAEERRFEAMTLTADAHAGEVAAPSESDLAAHLEENAASFAEPERRDVVWLHVSLDRLAQDVPVEESDLRALYEERRGFYETPETRVVYQIVYDDEEAAREAVERIETGEAMFDSLLVARGLSRDDADLGAVTAEDLGGERADLAFGIDGPGVVGPAELPTGWAVLEVSDISPGETVTFEEARAELQGELAAESARPEADRLAEEVADLRAAGATLEEISAELGLPLERVDGLGRNGALAGGGAADGLAGAPVFREEAFAAEPGEERPLLDAPDGGYFTLRVDAVEESATPPLAEIRDRVAESWRAERRRAALAEAAEAAVARIEGGEPLQAVADDLGAPVTELGPLRRDDPDPRLGAEARETLFRAAKPGAVAATVAPGRATVAVLAEIVEGEGVAEAVEALEAALAQSVAQDQLEYLGRALEAEMGVSINGQAVESVVSQIGG